MKEKIDQIVIIFVSILLMLASIFVNEGNPYEAYLKIASYGLLILYLIIRWCQKEPIKIIKNQFDRIILLLVISTMIPILTNTYVSLYGTIQTILQYMYAYSIYMIVREMTQRDTKFYNIVTNLLVIMTVIIIVIGIDGITFQYGKKMFEVLQLGEFLNGENRLLSVFGYSNSLAAYIASVLFLNMSLFLNENRKTRKAIYKTITLIFMIGIFLTYSKAILVIFPIFLLISFVFIKEKNKKMEIVQNIINSLLFSFLFLILYEKMMDTSNYLGIWIVLTIMIGINYLINLLIEKYHFKSQKMKNKKRAILFGGILLSGIIYGVIGLQIQDEYKVFTETGEEDYKAKIIHQLEGNTAYQFEFEIEAEAPKELGNVFIMTLLERDGKNQETNQTTIRFGNYKGKKKIKIITKEETEEIKIEWKAKYPEEPKKLTVKKLWINQKEVPLEYRFLPTKLVEKVQNIRVNYKTVRERGEMIKNAVTLIKENPITGIGGYGWEHQYKQVQSYSYEAKYLHSYVAKVFLEFGLIGILAYFGMLIRIIKLLIELVKKQEITQLFILLALSLLGIHSMFDIDMEHMYLLLYSFVLLGMLSSKKENKFKTVGLSISICNSVLLFSLIMSIYVATHMDQYNSYLAIGELQEKYDGVEITSQEYIEQNRQIAEKYETLIQYERYHLLERYADIIRYYLNAKHENSLEILQKYYEKIAKYEKKNWNNMNSVMEKTQYIYEVIQELENQNHPKYDSIIEKYATLLLEEYEKISPKIQEKWKITYEEKLKQVVEKVKYLKNQYLEGVRVINHSGISIKEQDLEGKEIEERGTVLLYHTHGTESYQAENFYETYEFYKSLDKNYNVIKVGEILTQLLEEKGISIIHDMEYHNYPNKTGTYARSRKMAQKILQENREINRMIDLHRDAYSEQEHEGFTVEIEGEKVAPLRFVIGINPEEEQWQYDLKWAIEMQKAANEKYPGLFQPILIRQEPYNQDLLKYAVLLEVGENCNQIEEALISMKYFSEILQ